MLVLQTFTGSYKSTKKMLRQFTKEQYLQCLEEPKMPVDKVKFRLKTGRMTQAVVAHAFNPSTQRERQVDLCEFEASLVYRVRARTGSQATERNPVSNNQKTKQKNTNKQTKTRKDKQGEVSHHLERSKSQGGWRWLGV